MKLIVFDGMAMVYRAYYAFNRNPRINSKGFNTSAVLGFTTTLFELIVQQHPTHAAVAFDVPQPTFRHELYADYKANRDAMPEVIQQSLPFIKQIIAAFNIPIVTAPGYEADDVIGTLAAMAEQHGFDEVLMVTPDKDFAQLVTDRSRIYRFGRMGRKDEILGVQEVLDKFDIRRCDQVRDLLGLWGDASDNIPGVPGIGERTAKKLIAQFDSIENMVAHSDEIKNNSVRDKIQQLSQQALFSKQLATIVRDVPISFDEQVLRLGTPNYDELSRLFDIMEFKNLAKRVFKTLAPNIPIPDDASAHQTDLFAPPVESVFDLLVSDEVAPPSSSVCKLASLSDVHSHDIALFFDGAILAVASDAETAFVSKIGNFDLVLLKQMVEDPKSTLLCYDLKQLTIFLSELDIKPAGVVFDVQLAHYLVDPESRHSLQFICQSVVALSPQSPEDCAAAMWLVYPKLASSLTNGNLQHLFYDVELPLVNVLLSMEHEGVRIDVEALMNYSNTLSASLAICQQQIYELAGFQFNISSPKQLGEVLFQKLKVVDKPPRTATKQFSTSEDVLLAIQDKHPIIAKILEYRSLSKLINTYLNNFPKLISPISGRLHTMFNQTVTATGRLSSSNPNLQNIPIRTELGREIRRAFVARNSDYAILAADYSQIELRIIAALANDAHMRDTFLNHDDIHAATASRIYGVPIGSVTKDQRRNAKSVSFGIIYGISAFGLSRQLGLSRKQASDLINEYFAQHPAIQNYINSNIDFARQHGYAQTLLGRRRFLPDINSRNASARSFAERNAVNMPIQGTSADMIKIAMLNIFNKLNELNLKTKMILQIHDELVFDLYRPEEEQVRNLVRHAMVEALPLPSGIPIEVSIDVGDNWLEAH